MNNLLLKPILTIVLIFGILFVQGLFFKDENPIVQNLSEESIKNKESSGPYAIPDWRKMFRSNTPLLEIFLRGSITYLALLFLLRIFLKRESGSLGVTDLLVVVLIADAAQNAMSDNYISITDGVLLVTIIIFWAYFLDLVGFYSPKIQNLIQPPPLPLIMNGKIIEKNLKKELITEQELMGQLRESGVERIQDIQKAFMESDGRISVLTRTESVRKVNKRRSF